MDLRAEIEKRGANTPLQIMADLTEEFEMRVQDALYAKFCTCNTDPDEKKYRVYCRRNDEEEFRKFGNRRMYNYCTISIY